MIPCMQSHQTTIFQQDNTPCHTSKAMQAFFRKSKISVLEWLGNSKTSTQLKTFGYYEEGCFQTPE